MHARIGHLAAPHGFAPTDEQLTLLRRYCDLLLSWGARINLTGAGSVEDLVEEHLPDAFAMAAVVLPSARVIDVGSGGGLPAIPFALLRPDARVTLIEPRAKRCAFLRFATAQLGAKNVFVRQSRIEDLEIEELATVLGGPFDAASSRATFSPEKWLALAPRLLDPGGHRQILVFATAEQMKDIALRPHIERPYLLRGHRQRVLGVFQCST
jgi:16S rRNA (guanine527-N7)-methyltransferase